MDDNIMPDRSETQVLLNEVRAGNDAVFSRLFARHRAYLRSVVDMRLDPRIRRRLDASDVVQETQLEALRRLKDYLREPALPFHLWLRKLACDRVGMLRRHHVEALRRTR